MENNSFYLVSYDIVDDRRRASVARILEDYGDRVQGSVFEVILDRDSRFNRMITRIEKTIDRSKDSVRVYYLCHSCRRKIRILGQGELFTDESAYFV